MDVICIDSKFPADTLDWWKKYGISHPEEGNMYTIESVVKHTTGDVGVRLVEIQNPSCPIQHPIMGVKQMVPTFSIKRFRTLAGDIVTKEEIEELTKEKV